MDARALLLGVTLAVAISGPALAVSDGVFHCSAGSQAKGLNGPEQKLNFPLMFANGGVVVGQPSVAGKIIDEAPGASVWFQAGGWTYYWDVQKRMLVGGWHTDEATLGEFILLQKEIYTPALYLIGACKP